MARQTKSSFEAMGYEVQIDDLYKKGFNPNLDVHDFKAIHDDDHFKPGVEQSIEDNLSEDILAEQALISWADILVFQFPIWWLGPPAILKGWFDRVLSVNFAYAWGGGIFTKGLLKGKVAFVSTTAGGGHPGFYGPGSMQGDVDHLFLPVEHATLFFTGMKVVKRFFADSVSSADDDTRAGILKALGEHCEAIDTLPKIDFVQGVKQPEEW